MEKTKAKKTITKIVNVLSIIIGVLVLIVAISAISSMSRGYSSLFGYTMYSVRTDSMEGDNPDSFNKGDLIIVKILSEEAKSDLEPGKVITFFDFIDINDNGVKEEVLNTHRIVSINTDNKQVTTKGDNAIGTDDTVDFEKIVGVYSSKIAGIGSVFLFIQSPTGFLVTIVIPSILVVIYCAFLLFKNLNVYNKEKRAIDLENMRKQILEDMKDKDNK